MIKINRLLNTSTVVSLVPTITLASFLLLASSANAEPGLDTRPSNQTCVAPARPDTGEVMLQQVFENLSFRVLMTIEYPPDDPSYLFGLDNAGRLHRFPNDPNTTEKTIALNLRSLFDGTSVSGQSGMMDMAFHPDFANNGELYVAYTVPSDPIVSYVARYRSFDGGETFSSNGEIILSEEQRGNQHNIGSLFFGRDGYLYIGFGDSLRRRFAADTSRRYGKLLRIDVDSGSPYAIPPDNPFVSGGGLPEIYAYGFRNPFRMTQDSGGTGEIWGGDVGNHDWEEVNKIVKGGNYGWPTYEGTHCFDGPCPDPTLIPPVHDYSHSEGCSVIGGFVYRGSQIPSLTGKYLFGDYCSGVISTIDDSGPSAVVNALITSGISIQDFTETPTGEIYVNDAASRILQLMPDASSGTNDNFPQNLSETGCFDAADPTRVAQGVIPFDVNSELWSDGAGKRRWLAIPDGTQITVQSDGDWDFPIGTVLVKEFSHNGSPFETRLLVRHDDGAWAGYTYEWNAALTDATLVPPEGLAKTIDGQLNWFYPSQAQCMQCHSEAAGRALGPETAQLNGDMLYPSGITSNQLETLEHIGMFANSLGGLPQDLPALVDVNDTSATLTDRSRSYLHSNCANCHRPNGPGQGPMDFRFQTEFGDMGACNVDPGLGDLGVPGAKLITPGSAASSVISLRMNTRGADQMPPLGTELVHGDGTAAIDAWINSLEACPATEGPGSGAYQPDGSGQFVMEAEHFDANTSAGGRDWVPDFTAGYVSDSAMQSVPDTFTKVTSNLNGNSPQLDYQIEVPSQTTYFVWVRGLGLSGSRDSVWVGVNGNDASATNVSINRGSYGWSRAGQVTLPAGIHTVNVWMREDGSILDRIMLSPSSTAPSGDGPPESPRSGGGGGGGEPPTNDPPVLAPVGNQAATEDQALTFDVSATDADTPVLSADLSQLPGSPSFVDNNNGTGTFSWAPPAGSAPGPYSVTFTATDALDNSLTSSETISIDVQEAPPGGGGGGSGAYQPDGSGQFVIEAENYDATTSASGRDWLPDLTAGYVGSSAMQSVPDSFTKINSNLNANSPRMDYEVEVPSQTTFNVWIRALGLSGSRDSIWVGANGNDGAAVNVTLNRGSYGWTSAGQLTLTAGVQTVNVWMREDGSIVDRVLLTPLSTTPTGDGPPESSRGDGGGEPPPNDPPVLNPVGNRAATEDQALTFDVSATDADTPVLSADLTQLPGSPSFVDNNDSTGTFSWTPPAGSAPGPYSVTFTATDSVDNTLTSAETISIDVQAAPPGGGGGGSGAYQPDDSGRFVMEAEHFDATTSASGRDWVSDFTPGYVGDSAMQSVPDSFTKITSNLNANSPRMDYQVELAAPATLNVWVRGNGPSGSRDSVWVGANGNDGAARSVTLTRGSYGWSGAGQLTLDSGVQTINVWMREDGSIIDRVLLTPLAGAPSGDGPPESARGDGGGSPLPLSDDFADGNVDDWTIVDDSLLNPSNWAVANQAFVQSVHTNNNGNDVTESYHRGSYAYWTASDGLTDYRLSVDVTPDAGSGDDIGVMFRYANASNYYRFTLNLLNGFARLEKNVNGTYMTLASDHRGYTPGALHTIAVEVEGPLMQVFVNGDPLFAASDISHASGGIALFSRDNSTFDNVSLTDNDTAAEIVIAAPEAHNVLPGASLDLNVAAVARNAPATNASVQFQYHSGGTPTLCSAATESSPGYYTAQCSAMPAGNYTVEALLLDNGAEVDRDSNAAVAVGSPAFQSHRYDAIGNSITRGDDDFTVGDNLGVSTPLVRSSAGWTALLTDLLVGATGSPNLVGNEGISGDRVTDVWNSRLFSIIERNPESDRALVMLGSNDSNTFNTTSVADYTANLQNIIDELLLTRDTVYVALLPPAWGRNTNPSTIYPDPLAATAERNQNTIAFNNAIQGLLPQAGVQLGPDFFSCFLTPTVNRFSLFDDPLHPNALGYQFMAALWRDALMAGPVVAPMDPCPSPIFILEDLDPYTYGLRQTLMEEGNQYYRDAAFTLTNIPPELGGGVWVQTSNADSANADSNFMSFSVGATSSTVYIAYDTTGSPPTSTTHAFTADTLSEALTTSDAAVGSFGIVSASSVTGTVTIGGTKSAGSPGAQQAYIVIVVPD